MKGLGSEANPTWLKTAGVLMLAEAQKHGKSPASDGRGQQLVPLTPPPHTHREHVSASYLERGIYTHTFFLRVCTLTHNKYTRITQDTRAHPTLAYPLPHGAPSPGRDQKTAQNRQGRPERWREMKTEREAEAG